MHTQTIRAARTQTIEQSIALAEARIRKLNKRIKKNRHVDFLLIEREDEELRLNKLFEVRDQVSKAA